MKPGEAIRTATGRLSPHLEKQLLDGALREVVEEIKSVWDGTEGTSGVLRMANYPWILEEQACTFAHQ